MRRLILASASPRRRELLAELGFDLRILPANVDESRHEGETPVAYVSRLAHDKAHAAYATVPLAPGEAIVAADTIVHMGNVTFGKPASDAEAAAMLRALAGNTHQVSTGVCVMVGIATPGTHANVCETTFVETTDVTFFDLADAEVAAYVASGEPRDKAGAYGVQATGRLLVREIRGDYFNVVGLPVARVVRVLAELAHGADAPGANKAHGEGALLPALLSRPLG